MIDAYLAAVDEAVPGFVAGLYITGSIALDDYQPAISDIDAVAVCTGRPDAGQYAALAQVHAGGGLRRTELGPGGRWRRARNGGRHGRCRGGDPWTAAKLGAGAAEYATGMSSQANATRPS